MEHSRPLPVRWLTEREENSMHSMLRRVNAYSKISDRDTSSRNLSNIARDMNDLVEGWTTVSFVLEAYSNSISLGLI